MPDVGSSDVLEAIRQKYPQYSSIPDDELGKAISSKYSVYADGIKKTLAARSPQGRQAQLQNLGAIPKTPAPLQKPPLYPANAETPTQFMMEPVKPLVKLEEAVDPLAGALRQAEKSKIVPPAVRGVAGELQHLRNSALSPIGLATMATADSVPIASKLMSLGFAAQAGSQVKQAATELGAEMGKPPAQRDKEKIARLWTQLAGSGATAALAGAHGLSEIRPAIRTMDNRLVIGQQGDVHNDIIAKNNLKAQDIDRRLFVDKEGNEISREQLGKAGVPGEPESVPGAHATGLAEAQELHSMGGATRNNPEEFRDPNEPSARETYGIAQRVRERMAKQGEGPDIQPGQGITAPDSVERGRELIQGGTDPEKVMANFEATKRLSSDDMAAVRAHGELLRQRQLNTERDYGTDSDEYRQETAIRDAWEQRMKPMQTEWHKAGMAQQGETDIDTGSFTGLRNAYKSDSGKEFTPRQATSAKAIAARVDKAATATAEAQAKIKAAIAGAKTDVQGRVSGAVANPNPNAPIEDAEARAMQAVHERHQEIGEMAAKTDVKGRVVENTRNVEENRDAAAQKALKAAQDVAQKQAKRVADAENKARVAQAGRDKQVSQMELARERKALQAAQKRVTQAAAKAAKTTREALANPERQVWEKAADYFEKGETDFNDIRNKVATDLGLSVKQVTALLARDKRVKYLADDLWMKQQRLRQFDQAAKRWIREQQSPGYQRAISKIPRAMFALKVGFHGTVALGTHAPMVAFQPKWWHTYIVDFGRMYKMVNPYKGKGASYYEMTMQDLVRRPNFAKANRAGLVNDPFQYEDFNNPQVSQYFGTITGMGNRGYSVLKVLRQDMFDQMWNQLPKTAQIPEVAERLATGINHVTGVTKTPPPKGANLVGFAPRLLASRAAWLVTDPAKAAGTFIDWRNADIGDKQFAVNQAKEKAWVVGTMMTLLAINQGFLSATGSKEKINVTDPTKSDFLKFKVAGTDISYGNPMISMARMPARLFVAVKNEGKLNKVIPEDEKVSKIATDFARSQLSPVAGTLTDLGIGRDFEERPLPRAAFGLLPGKTSIPKSLRRQGITTPYTWKEYTARTLAPIPFEEAQQEVFKNGFGMTEEQAKQAARVVVALGTGARLSEDYSK